MTQKTKDKKDYIAPVFRKTARSYQAWNATTAECFRNKLCCSKCPNREDCQIQVMYQNPYNIQNIKYAVLMTYANIGENGIDLYFTKLAKN